VTTDFAVIGDQLWSTITKTFSLIKLNGPFFNWTEWSQIFFWGLHLFFVLCMSTISRFWLCRGWRFIIFDEWNIFLSHRYTFGTCGNRISARFWFAFIPSFRACVLFLVYNAAIQLALQLQQERIQVVHSNKVVRGLPNESNGTPMDLGQMNVVSLLLISYNTARHLLRSCCTWSASCVVTKH